MSKHVLIALLLTLALLSACSSQEKGKIQGADAAPAALPTLATSYSVNGVDPRGTDYGGNLQVRPGAAPGTYALQWIITGSIQEGFGQVRNQLLVHRRTRQRHRAGCDRPDHLHHHHRGTLRPAHRRRRDRGW